MATRGVVYVVFLLPIIFSIVFGSLVLAEALKEPGRELNMLQFKSDSHIVSSQDVKILGLETQYSTSDPVEIEVIIDDQIFDCGDLYITIYDVNSSSKQVVTQSGFFNQCYAKNNLKLPIDDEFSEIIDVSGNYEIVVEMLDIKGKNSISSAAKFTVK